MAHDAFVKFNQAKIRKDMRRQRWTALAYFCALILTLALSVNQWGGQILLPLAVVYLVGFRFGIKL